MRLSVQRQAQTALHDQDTASGLQQGPYKYRKNDGDPQPRSVSQKNGSMVLDLLVDCCRRRLCNSYGYRPLQYRKKPEKP
jgi:hypothetical protein